MFREHKIAFVENFRKKYDIGAQDTFTTDLLDQMWELAEKTHPQYPGLKKYCSYFNDSYLAQITKRARMRALLEVSVQPVRHNGSIPGREQFELESTPIPAYVGTGNGSTGSALVPTLEADGSLGDRGISLILTQALTLIQGHQTKYARFLTPETEDTLNKYVSELAKDAEKAAMRAFLKEPTE